MADSIDPALWDDPDMRAALARHDIGEVYQLLKGEVDTDRSLTLEVAIVILIISELLLALASLFSRP